jgi:hypothetical protein
MDNIMGNIEHIINSWDKIFKEYQEARESCGTHIQSILEIKNNLSKLIGNQKKDDILFYKSIIYNSYYYLNKSLEIRKLKFIKDLNYIWHKIDDRKKFTELNNSNFTTLLKDFRKAVDDIYITKLNNTSLSWVKDDTIVSLEEINKELDDILNYHLRLINSFLASVINEYNFFCIQKKT